MNDIENLLLKANAPEDFPGKEAIWQRLEAGQSVKRRPARRVLRAVTLAVAVMVLAGSGLVIAAHGGFPREHGGTGLIRRPTLYDSKGPATSFYAEESVRSIVPVQPGTLLCPVPDVVWSSRGFYGSHRGLDLNAEAGTPIYAAAAGTVLTAEWHWSYGNYIVIDHGGGLQTVYSQCEALYADAGQSVEQGDHIAALGSTGDATGPVCHFEVLVDDELVDPLEWIELPEDVFGP